MKRALFVAYPFPPTGGAPVRRTLKFLKFLERYGWSASVLTVKEEFARHPDPQLLAEVPRHCRVHRTASLGVFFKQGEMASLRRSASSEAGSLRALLKRLRSIGGFFAIPEAYILWAPFALRTGLKVAAQERCAVIYATGPPFTDFLVGALLKRWTGRPLVVDFRDAWIAEPAKVWPCLLRKRIEEKLERFVIRSADAVICATEGVTEDFKRRYKRFGEEKFVAIPNGYDPDDFSGVPPGPGSPGKFRIVHTGILRRERTPREFLAALGDLLREEPRLRSVLEVVFVGDNLRFNDGLFVEDYLDRFHLHDVVHLTGFVPRRRSIAYQKSADLLLLIVGKVSQEKTRTYGIAGKLFDYMVAGKPILAVAERGPVHEILKRTGLGVAVDPNDLQGLKNVLKDYVEGKAPGYRPNPPEIERYHFHRLTGELVRVFERVCTRRSET